jgi:hypothetical protein
LIFDKAFTLSAILAGVLLTSAGPCSAQLAVPVSTAAESTVDSSSVAAVELETSHVSTSPSASLPTTPIPADTSAADGNWHFSVSPYLWFSGIHGGIGVNGQEVGVHASAADLLSHFRFGLMGVVEPRYKRIVMPLDIVWVRLGDDRALTNLGTVGNFKASEFILTQKVGYRLVETKMFQIDALAGFRYWHYGQSVSFTTNTLNFSSSQNWVDPLVGGRITGNLSPKVSVTIAGDVGGWGAGSQLDYQIAGLLGYRIKPAVALQLGYRYLAVNYRNSSTGNARFANLVTSGIVAGATFNLK